MLTWLASTDSTVYFSNMSKEEAKVLLAHLKEYVEETTASQEKAVEALIAAGILKPNGELKEIYQA